MDTNYNKLLNNLTDLKLERMKDKGQSCSQLQGQNSWMKKTLDGIHNSLIKS